MDYDDWPARRTKVYAEFDGLGIRTKNALLNMGVTTTEEVAELSNDELLRMPNFGKKSLGELRAFLRGVEPKNAALDARLHHLMTRLNTLREKASKVEIEINRLNTELSG